MATPEKTQTKRMTNYVVLSRERANSNDIWRQIHSVEGVSAQDAIRSAVKAGAEGETFVAVPVRSWKPMTRKVEQVTKEIWS